MEDEMGRACSRNTPFLLVVVVVEEEERLCYWWAGQKVGDN
jgi:hypothetical protein